MPARNRWVDVCLAPGRDRQATVWPAAILLLASAAAALAQSSVEGSVINSLTGEPLARAHVTMRGSGKAAQYGAITTAAGKFSIAGVPPGQYYLQAEHAGFSMPAGLTGSSFVTLALAAGEAKTGLKVNLTPFGSITGKVLDANGEPVEWVRVSAENDDGAAGFPGTTDDHGEFRIGGLRPGKYRIRATPANIPAPPEIRSDGTAEVHYVATYHPNVIDAKEATRVAVRPAAETKGIEVRLWKTPVVRVSGAILAIPAGASNLQLELQRDDLSYGTPGVQADGSFTLWRLDPGRYTATGYCVAGGRRMRSAPVEFEVGSANIDQIDLRIIPPADLVGQVLYGDEEATEKSANASPHKLILEDAGHRMSTQPVSIDADGRFHVVNVSPGKYMVRIVPPAVYVRAVRLGTAESTGALLDLRGGAAGASVTLVLSGALGAVSGTVSTDGAPTAGAQVLLAPETPTPGINPVLTNTTQDGGFSFAGVQPGRYRLVAADPNDPKSVEDFADRVEHIEVEPRDELMQDLILPGNFRIGVRK